MNPALLLLLRLRARGAWRKLVRTVRQPKGALLIAFGVVLLGMIFLPNLLVGRRREIELTNLWFFDPAALLAMWLLFAVTARNATALAFTMPEVEFLFAGPFSRRQLLAYKLTTVSLGPSVTALLMPLFLWRSVSWWPAVVLGVWLTFVFMQTTALLVSLAMSWLGAVRIRWRVTLVVIAALLLALTAWQGRAALQGDLPVAERLAVVETVWVARAVLAPFEIFSRLLQADTAGQLAVWGGAALGANAAVMVFVLWLDANFLEASLAASQRRYEWLQRAKRGGGVPSFRVRSKPWLSLPRFPRLGGAGPIAWRQALELLRNSGRLIFILPAVIVAAAPALFTGPQGLIGSIVIVVVFISFLTSAVMPMGLRADLEHAEALRSLPLPASAVVWGSIASAVMYPTILQIAAVALLSALARQWSLASTLAVGFALPLNLLLVAVDSVLVLLFPSTRRFAPGDFLAFPRAMLTYGVKFLYILVAGIVPGLYLLAVYLILGDSPVAMAAGVWIALVAEGAATVWLASLLFDRFDLSVETANEQ